MNLFDYINFYYVGSVTIIIWTAIKTIKPKHTIWKKIISIVIGLAVGVGFLMVDYKFSQGDISENLQKLFLRPSLKTILFQ